MQSFRPFPHFQILIKLIITQIQIRLQPILSLSKIIPISHKTITNLRPITHQLMARFPISTTFSPRTLRINRNLFLNFLSPFPSSIPIIPFLSLTRPITTLPTPQAILRIHNQILPPLLKPLLLKLLNISQIRASHLRLINLFNLPLQKEPFFNKLNSTIEPKNKFRKKQPNNQHKQHLRKQHLQVILQIFFSHKSVEATQDNNIEDFYQNFLSFYILVFVGFDEH